MKSVLTPEKTTSTVVRLTVNCNSPMQYNKENMPTISGSSENTPTSSKVLASDYDNMS